MRAKHAMKAGLAGEVDALVGQSRNDPRRRRRGEARFVGDRDDPGPLGLAQRLRRHRTIGVWPPITLPQTVTGLPAPQRAGVDAGQGTGRGEPGSVRTGLFLRQEKSWKGEWKRNLKPFEAIQRVRPPPGRGAARQPEASLAWETATSLVKRRQQMLKPCVSLEIVYPLGPSVWASRGRCRQDR